MRQIVATVPTHIRLPKPLNDELNRKARKHKTSKAELIRHLLKKGVLAL